MIENFLNIKNSTRNLTDKEFDKILPILAKELKNVNYYTTHSEDKLKDDWNKLVSWESDKSSLNSTSRIGMKLCDHFFPNFYEISANKKCSFSKMWQDEELLKKILIWNRKSHSTPYLSELKRGIYFCGGIVKSTMYRPQMAKLITKNRKCVFDPCAGWGGRMLGSVANGCDYYAFEPNKKTYKNLINLIKFLNIESKVTIICDDARNMKKYNFPAFDCILTSPPYFDLEVYSDEDTQSIFNIDNYSEWVNSFLKVIVQDSVEMLDENGISCWNVAKIKDGDMWVDILDIHSELGFNQVSEYSLVSSKRQTNGKGKSQDLTKCFMK